MILRRPDIISTDTFHSIFHKFDSTEVSRHLKRHSWTYKSPIKLFAPGPDIAALGFYVSNAPAFCARVCRRPVSRMSIEDAHRLRRRNALQICFLQLCISEKPFHKDAQATKDAIRAIFELNIETSTPNSGRKSEISSLLNDV